MRNNICLKKVTDIYTTEFRMRFKALLMWSGGVMAIMFLYMLLFPSIQEMAIAKFEAMPEQLLALFGMGDLADFAKYNTYFSSIYQIIMLIIGAYAVTIASNTLHEEESSGTIEFLNANKVSRLEIYIAKTAIVITNIAIISLASMVAVIISGVTVASDSVNVIAIINTILLVFIAFLAFTGIGFIISAFTKKSIKASGIGLGIFFASYLIGYLGKIGPDSVAFLKWFSPLDFLSANNIMKSTIGTGAESFNVFGIILGLILFISTTAGGYIIYRKKDLG